MQSSASISLRLATWQRPAPGSLICEAEDLWHVDVSFAGRRLELDQLLHEGPIPRPRVNRWLKAMGLPRGCTELSSAPAPRWF